MKFLRATGIISFFAGLAGWIIFGALRSQGQDVIGIALLIFPALLVLSLVLLAMLNLIKSIQKKNDVLRIFMASFLLFASLITTVATSLFISLALYFPGSPAFIEFQKRFENDPKVIEKFGVIQYYGIMPEGKFGTHEADFHVTVYGEKRKSNVYFKAHLENGSWVVEVLNY